jgi:hypothetical protein
MQSSIKQIIINAVIKVSGENPSFNGPAQPSAEEARDSFIALLIAELFPENSAVEIAMAPKETDTASVTSEKKKRGPMSEEAKAAMKAKRDATIAAKKAAEPAAEVKEVETDAESATTTEKKKRGPMSEEAKAAMKAKRDATIAAKKAGEPAGEVKEKVKKVKEVKPVDSEANLSKIDATWRKYLKKAAGDKATKEMEGQLITFLNAMDKDAFNGSKAEEHVKAFLEPKDEKVETEMVVVEFNGKDYYVNPETKRVYEGEGEYDEESEEWTNYKGVGYVGMAVFAEMELDM